MRVPSQRRRRGRSEATAGTVRGVGGGKEGGGELPRHAEGRHRGGRLQPLPAQVGIADNVFGGAAPELLRLQAEHLLIGEAERALAVALPGPAEGAFGLPPRAEGADLLLEV